MNFVTNVFKKYLNKNDATQSNPSHTMEPPPKIEIIPPSPVEYPLAERGGKSEDEEAFEDASEMNPTLSNKEYGKLALLTHLRAENNTLPKVVLAQSACSKEPITTLVNTPMMDNSNSGHSQTEKKLFSVETNNDKKSAVFIDGINETDDVHKSKIPGPNPTDPNNMTDSLKGQLIQESETFKDTDNDIINNAQPELLSEIHCKPHQTLDEAPFKDHLKLDANPPIISGSQDKPIQAEATVQNIGKTLIQQDSIQQNEGLELKTPEITVEGQDLSEPMTQLKREKITDKGEDSSKDKIDGNQILIGDTLKVEEGTAIECGIINSEPKTVTDQFKMQEDHVEKHSKQHVIEITDREEAQNYICMEDIVKVSKLDSAEAYADIDSSKRYLERQDTKEFEKIEKQFQKEEVEIRKTTDQGVAGSYIIEENEELLLDDLDKILDEELNRSNDLNYMRQDTREFERLEKQFAEKSKPNNRQIEDILEQLVEESTNNATRNLEDPNNLTDLVKITPKQNISTSQGNLTDLSSETLTKQEHKSTEVEEAINSRPVRANERIFRKETNGFEAAEKNFVQDKYQSKELLDVDMKVDETQPLKDGCELDNKKVDSSLKTVIHISQNEIETANAILDEDTMSEFIPESTKIKSEDEQVGSGSDNCRLLNKNSTSYQSNISILPEASSSGVKHENLVKEATKITNKLIKPLSMCPKKPAKNKVEVRPTFRNKQNSQIVPESNSFEIDENEELKKKVISLQQELESLKNPKADNNLLSLSSEVNLSGDMPKYRKLLAEYEKQIALQACELDKLKQESEKNMRHFTNTEMAFSDVFEKYEKAKVVISAYRQNEEVLLENIEMAEEQVIALENKCAVMKEQSMEQIRIAQEQVKYEKNKYTHEMAKLQAQVKRLEIKASSLELELKQKKEECQALAALCDDITGRTSN